MFETNREAGSATADRAARDAEPWHVFASALAQAKESVVITDADLQPPGPRILYANPAFTRMSGYTAEEVHGRSPRILQGPKSDRSVLDQLRAALEKGESFEGEAINYRKDGSEFHLEWQVEPLRDKDGTITNFVAFQRDITARKRAEQDLAESEQRYRLLVERSPGAVFVYCEEQTGSFTPRIVYANPAAAKLLGASDVREVIGLEIWRMVHPEYREAVKRRIELLAAGQPAPLIEQKYVRLDGTCVDVETVGIPFVFEGKPAVQVIAHDLTHKKRLEEQFMRAQRLESLSMLATGIAHDLNNVLAPIQIAVPLLGDENMEPGARAELLRDVERSVAHGAELIRQIHTFAHGTGGKRESLEVASLFRRLATVLEKIVPEHVHVVRELAPDIWHVLGISAQLHQALLNLAMNARDAMPDGGTLILRARNRVLDEAQAARIPGGKPGKWVAIEVKDTGTGISPAALERLWHPFFTTKSAQRNVGLGLSTARGIVNEHGGFIDVVTALGSGTSFFVYLPADEQVAIETPRRPVIERGEGELVLVVDDEPGIRVVATAILLQNGYSVLACADGEEALRVFAERRDEVKLVFTDLVMPGLNGRELATRLRELAPDVRIIAMSGLEHEKPAGGKTSNSFDGFLLKPFTVATMLTLARDLLSESK